MPPHVFYWILIVSVQREKHQIYCHGLVGQQFERCHSIPCSWWWCSYGWWTRRMHSQSQNCDYPGKKKTHQTRRTGRFALEQYDVSLREGIDWNSFSNRDASSGMFCQLRPQQEIFLPFLSRTVPPSNNFQSHWGDTIMPCRIQMKRLFCSECWNCCSSQVHSRA